MCGLSLQPIGCTSALDCDVQRHCSCSCRLWRYISVMPLFLPFAFKGALLLRGGEDKEGMEGKGKEQEGRGEEVKGREGHPTNANS